MRILKIELTNIRCFEHLVIDLSNNDGTKSWLMILGENGVGKTTLLRSIALGLCELSGASGLCAEVPGEWVRLGQKEGKIRIDILPSPTYVGDAYVETTLTRGLYKETNLKQKTVPEKPSKFDWTQLFVCGYGSARSVYGSMDVSEYAVTDSVYSLFNYNSELQNPELSLRRLEAEKIEIGQLFRKLEEILMLESGSIELSRSGITVDGPWGRAAGMSTLGDGYKSTLTWMLDIFGWKLLSEDNFSDIEFEGIIIIDEIEKHLHPKWQKQLIGLLSKQFPKLQFIVSTHSPLCVIGTTEITDDNCCIVVAKQGSTTIELEFAKPPRGKRVDQVLTSYLFKLLTTSDNKVKRDIERYNQLFNLSERTIEEKSEQDELFKILNESLSSDESELEKNVADALNKALDILFKENIEKANKTNSPEKFELIRQLKELL